MDRVDIDPRRLVLPADDVGEPFGLYEADRSRELVDAEVQPVDAVVRLAVVPERARELDRFFVAGDEHAALARRDRLRRCERPDADVAERSCAASVPLGA